jgi:1-deoxy-D-xylulose-5-phosphate synthase
MSSGTGIDAFAEKHKDRFFDVGIAEEHAVTFASALAANGMKPVFAVYSTFLQRGYDQIIHDAALQRLPITLAIDRAGFNEADGATHHGVFDVAFLSHVPGVKIYTPVTYNGLARSLELSVNEDGISAIRYPSGSESAEVVKAFYEKDSSDSIGIKTDFDTNNVPENIIITHGRIVSECLSARAILQSDGVDCGIMLCEYISPYSKLADEIYSTIKNSPVKTITFVEEEIRAGGFGMLLSDAMRNKGYLDGIDCTVIAADDAFIKRKKGQTYLRAIGLDANQIAEKIKERNN